MEAPATSSVSTTCHDSSAFLVGYADKAAQIRAKLQQKNLPWLCPQLKIDVTNELCLDMKANEFNRRCRDCGIPNILPKQEGQPMSRRGTCVHCERDGLTLVAKGLCGTCYGLERKGKLEPKGVPVSQDVEKELPAPVISLPPVSDEVPEEPSWDDFEPFMAPAIRFGGLFCQVSAKDIRLSAEAATKAEYKEGQHVEIAYRKDPSGLALRTVNTGSCHTRKITKARGGAQVQISIQPIIKSCNIPKGKYPVTVTTWGIVVHLDRVI